MYFQWFTAPASQVKDIFSVKLFYLSHYFVFFFRKSAGITWKIRPTALTGFPPSSLWCSSSPSCSTWKVLYTGRQGHWQSYNHGLDFSFISRGDVHSPFVIRCFFHGVQGKNWIHFLFLQVWGRWNLCCDVWWDPEDPARHHDAVLIPAVSFWINVPCFDDQPGERTKTNIKWL